MLCSHGGRWYWTHDKDMGLVPTYVLLQKQVIIGVRSPTLNHLTCPNSYHAGYSPGGRWYWTHDKDMGLVPTYVLLQKQVIIGAGHPHWWQWNHLQIATMLDTALEGDDTEPTTRIWASILVWIPLPPSSYHTHTCTITYVWSQLSPSVFFFQVSPAS